MKLARFTRISDGKTVHVNPEKVSKVEVDGTGGAVIHLDGDGSQGTGTYVTESADAVVQALSGVWSE